MTLIGRDGAEEITVDDLAALGGNGQLRDSVRHLEAGAARSCATPPSSPSPTPRRARHDAPLRRPTARPAARPSRSASASLAALRDAAVAPLRVDPRLLRRPHASCSGTRWPGCFAGRSGCGCSSSRWSSSASDRCPSSCWSDSSRARSRRSRRSPRCGSSTRSASSARRSVSRWRRSWRRCSPALMITARAGSGMATELGSMRITEQIDALTTFAVDPIQYLVTPRVVATILMMPIMTMVFNIVGLRRRLPLLDLPRAHRSRTVHRAVHLLDRPEGLHHRRDQGRGLRRDAVGGRLLPGLQRARAAPRR